MKRTAETYLIYQACIFTFQATPETLNKIPNWRKESSYSLHVVSSGNPANTKAMNEIRQSYEAPSISRGENRFNRIPCRKIN